MSCAPGGDASDDTDSTRVWLDTVRAGFREADVVRRAFRAALDRGELSWSHEPSWPYAPVPRPLPRTIWIYWQQGWERAPEIALRCRERWIRKNPGWTVRALDAAQVRELVDLESIVGDREISAQHTADIVRLLLLARYGGVWVDANTVCTRPLEAWLPLLMQSGFFAFARPRPDRVLSSWFIASEPGGLVVERWLALARRYWSVVSAADHYFWVHYLFAHGCAADAEMAAGWHLTPHVSAYGSLQAQLLKFGADAEAEVQASIARGAIPVFKLTHGDAYPAEADDTPLARMTRALLAP